MRLDILLSVVEELSLLLTGARVERVLQGEDRALYLLFRNNRTNYALLLSPLRALPRLHLASAKPRSSSDPHPLVLHLRSRITGARLASVSLLNQDRVVELRFAKPESECCLVFEVTGPSANLFLLDADGRILAAYHPVSAGGNAPRTLLPGARYVPPAVKTFILPNEAAPRRDDSVSPNKAVEADYERLARERQTAAVRSQLRSAVKKSLARAERLHAALSRDLEGVQDAETFRIKGDLILANLPLLNTGMANAELAGYDGSVAAVELDPRFTPARNAELYFKKYKKAKAGGPVIRSRLFEAEKKVSLLRLMLDELEQAVDLDVLRSLLARFPGRGITRKGGGPKREAAADTPPGVKKIEYHGWEILVGRSGAGNDLLTTKLARPDDLWLHAEGLPGSHVLVRNPNRSEVPADILLKAAALAAMFSKGKTAVKVPVTYTPARFVKKPRGAKPGLVTLSQRKTIMVKPDDGTLK
jgi:predicted ribosome quality control (RQC) complex YloA/Tae2 family protein